MVLLAPELTRALDEQTASDDLPGLILLGIIFVVMAILLVVIVGAILLGA